MKYETCFVNAIQEAGTASWLMQRNSTCQQRKARWRLLGKALCVLNLQNFNDKDVEKAFFSCVGHILWYALGSVFINFTL